MIANAWIEVAFPLNLNQVFTYAVPPELEGCLSVGQRVIAPLGQRDQQGMIVDLLEEPPTATGYVIREIRDLVDPVPIFDPALVSVLRWMSRYYFTPLGKVLQTAIPADARLKKDVLVQYKAEERMPENEIEEHLAEKAAVHLSALKRKFGAQIAIRAVGALQRLGRVDLENEFRDRVERYEWLVRPCLDTEALPGKTAHKQSAVWEALHDAPTGIPFRKLEAELGCSRDTIRRMEKRGLVQIESIPPALDPLRDYHQPRPDRIVLNQEQASARNALVGALEAGKFSPFLLFGVPGSGKTEVYLEVAARTVAQERSVIVLVPEIALAPQIAHRFQHRFGDRVVLWHSNLRGAERLWTWQRIQRGRARVVVGARSAILTPIQDLGLIIVDEEQEHSYKQDESEPRYHARDVALVRGREHGAVVVLGTATPSLETYYNRHTDRYGELTLTRSWQDRTGPLVEVVDMRHELEETEAYSNPLSRKLSAAIQQTVEDGKQVILFQNRRGYSPIVRCRDCGWVMQCPNDEISLTYHKYGNKMRCHYCDHQSAPPTICPTCNSTKLQYGGTGTQKVEEALGEISPELRVIRMDMDTTRGKGAHQKLLGAFARGEADILLGTQMIAKGLDFERVTLVGVVNADAGLHFPDFRARERTFQLIYQVSGRAGRGAFPGKVIIQTWMPEDPAIQSATRKEIKGFYNRELDERNQLNYPPFSRLAALSFYDRNRDAVIRAAEAAAHRLSRQQELQVLGPAPALIERSPRGYHWKLILKSPKGSDPMGVHLRAAIHELQKKWDQKRVRLIIDMDPYQLL